MSERVPNDKPGAAAIAEWGTSSIAEWERLHGAMAQHLKNIAYEAAAEECDRLMKTGVFCRSALRQAASAIRGLRK